MQKNNEIWKDIKGYEGIYQVSNLGRIKRLTFKNNIVEKYQPRIKNMQKHNNGYLAIRLYKNGNAKNKLVHRLVAQAFLQNYKEHLEVNHIDGNKKNNNVENLEMVNRLENVRHAFRNGLVKPPALGKFGKDNPKALKVDMFSKNGEYIKTFGALIEASQYVGAKKSCLIVSCCKGKLKSAYGYVWRYSTH